MLRYAKAVVGLVLTVVWFAAGEGLVPDEWLPWARVAFVVALTYGIWRVPNQGYVEVGGGPDRGPV